MEKEITDLFREKTFHELNELEREQLAELCESEEEFEQMRNLFAGIEAIKAEEFKPKAETKASLDALFAAQAQKRPVIWYNSLLIALYPQDKPIQRRPLIQIAAALVVVLLAIPFLNKEKLVQESTPIAKVEKKEAVKTNDESSTKSAVTENGSGTKSPIQSFEQQNFTQPESQSGATIEKEDQQMLTTISDISLAESRPEDLEVAMAAPSAKSETVTVAKDFNHPDGVFSGTVISYSKSVKQQPAVLDLLTAAF